MSKYEFLKGQIEWAKGILAKPDVLFVNGRHSHDAAREVLIDSEDKLEDLVLEKGRFNINGQLVYVHE